jgi:hypothetical protein
MSVMPGARQSYLLAGAALTVLGLAGCSSSSDSDPTSLPTLSPSASAASPTPSVSPSGTGKKAELAAATAVVKQYYSLLNRLSTKMDADGFAAITAPRCSCRGFVRDIRLTAAKGQTYFGVDHLEAVKPVYVDPTTVQVLVRYSSAGGGIKSASGTVIHHGEPTHHASLNFQLSEQHSRWLIYEIDLLSKGR